MLNPSRFENGRRYHAFREGSYPMPNDEEEQERMDLGHHIYSLLLEGKLCLAPISPNAQRVLDLGTGTGIWAIDFAENPPNCTFEIDDFEDEWLYQTGFDFIHGRELGGCIGDIDRLLRQAFKHLVPEGYIELQGVDANLYSDDGTIEHAPNAQLWMQKMREACTKFGKPVDGGSEWKARLIKAGFVDVHQEVRKLPIGPWPKDSRFKELGKYQVIQELKVVESYTPKLFEYALGWSVQEIQILMAKVKRELQDPSVHLYLPVTIAWGRKPGEEFQN
ncbi:S-adenosyl-L-methionine-dependent methyltransferase [Fusarium acuminatum]|uniref:S-adenosyl-L-methionine-dependent methyltransferase n=1 Tax=Fusarium acuminatum TaxID=5515 RepID=A0ABZ2X2H2_9HYPO